MHNPGRRWGAGALMGALLAVLLLGAEASRRYRLRTIQVALDPPVLVPAAQVIASLPRGWTVRNDLPGGALAEEAGGLRKLSIIRQKSRTFLSPLQYLVRAGIVKDASAASLRATRIGHWPALMVSDSHRASGMGGERARINRVVAAVAVLRGGDILCVRITATGRPDASDEDLVQRICQSMEVRETPPPAPASAQFQLGDSVRLTVPEHFVTAPVDDPYRAGLRLLRGDADGWLGVELLPCVFLPGDGSEALAAMLAARDPGRPIGAIVQRSGSVWLCRWTAPDERMLTMAYLMVNGDGQALLADFAADLPDADDIESTWNAIAASVKFAPQTDLAPRLSRGTETARLAQADLGSVLAWVSAGERWLWYDQSVSSRQRWTGSTWRFDEGWVEGARSTQTVALDGTIAEVQSQWRLSRDLRYYRFSSAQQETRVEFSQVNTTARLPAGATRHWSGPAPSQYVPGALLAAVLSAARDEPMLLRTESCVLAEGAALSGLLTLLIEPRADLPRRQDGSEKPMRCLGVSINGTGEVSRWYFNDAGELTYIDLAGGIRMQRQAAP